VSYNYANGAVAANAESATNAGYHSLFLHVGSEYYAESFNFSAGTWHGFAEFNTPPNSLSCAGIDSTQVMCFY
jgi:hypothetical protein